MANPRNVRERIYWEYAKLVAASAVRDGERDHLWRFTSYTYRRLVSGEMRPSDVTRDNRKLVREVNACAYCNAGEPLQWEHIIPRSLGGPDTIDNQVLACGVCNRSKGSKDLLAWRPVAEVPPIVLSKYLKLLLLEHERNGTADSESFPEGQPVRLGRLHLVFRSR